MSYRILTTTQRDEAWRQARCGFLTSSAADAVTAQGRKKGEESFQRRDLRLRLSLERLLGEPHEEGFKSAEMKRGAEKEPDAIAAYQAFTGELVKPVGFIAHPTLMAGASPDGLIGSYGAIEVKVPKSATHYGYIRAGKLPEDYENQIRQVMWIAGVEWCDFVSFDDRFPPAMRLFVYRVEQKPVEADAWELVVTQFLREVDTEYAEISRRCMTVVAA